MDLWLNTFEYKYRESTGEMAMWALSKQAQKSQLNHLSWDLFGNSLTHLERLSDNITLRQQEKTMA